MPHPLQSEAFALGNVSHNALDTFTSEEVGLRVFKSAIRHLYFHHGPQLSELEGLDRGVADCFIMETKLQLPMSTSTCTMHQKQRILVLLAAAALSRTHRPCKAPIALLGQCIQSFSCNFSTADGHQLHALMVLIISTTQQLMSGSQGCSQHDDCCHRAQSSLLLAASAVFEKNMSSQETDLDAGQYILDSHHQALQNLLQPAHVSIYVPATCTQQVWSALAGIMMLTCIKRSLRLPGTPGQTCAIQLLSSLLAAQLKLPAVQALFCDTQPVLTEQQLSGPGLEQANVIKAAVTVLLNRAATGRCLCRNEIVELIIILL